MLISCWEKNWDLSFFPHISGWVHDFSIINRLCFVCCWISCRNQSGAKYYVTTKKCSDGEENVNFWEKNWDLSFFPHISGWVHDFSIINRLCFVCCWISCRNQSGAKYYVTTANTTSTPLSSLFVSRSLSFLPFFNPCTIFLSKLKHTSLKKKTKQNKIYIYFVWLLKNRTLVNQKQCLDYRRTLSIPF